jgi:hypothetical protein
MKQELSPWKIDLQAVEIIGGMRPVDGTSPFASASLVVREREAPHRIARVSRYEGEQHAVGEPLNPEEWQALCSGDHAHAFAETVPIPMGACMWLLRESFNGRDAALAELRAAGVILHAMYDGRTDTKVLVVRENDANGLRDGWAEQAYTRAMEQGRLGRWERALTNAEHAYVLGRGPIARHWALLALCYERVGRPKRAEGMLQVARRSHGAAMADDVAALRRALEAELSTPAPTGAQLAAKAPGAAPIAKTRAGWRNDAREQAESYKRLSLNNLNSRKTG